MADSLAAFVDVLKAVGVGANDELLSDGAFSQVALSITTPPYGKTVAKSKATRSPAVGE